MGNAAAEKTIDDWCAKLRAMPQFIAKAAPAAALAFDGVLKAELAGGRAPDGSSWAPTKDGHAPLQHAGDYVQTRAVGSVILTRVRGHYFFHNKGTAKVPARHVIPRGALPPRLGAAIRASLMRSFREAMAK